MIDFGVGVSRRRAVVLAGALAAGPLTGTRAGAAAAADRRTNEGSATNVQVTRDGFDAHIEPVIAVDPGDPRHLLVAFRAFTGSRIGVAAGTSHDGGRTWRALGMLPGLVPDACGNATAAFDEAGNAYVCAVQASAQSRQGDALLWRLRAGEQRFRPPVMAISGGGGLADHPWMGLGGSTCEGQPVVHVAGRLFGTAADGLVVTRSLDGGRSFEPPRPLKDAAGPSASSPVLAAAEHGALTVVFSTTSPSGGVAVRAVSSHDHGLTFGSARTLLEVEETAPDLSPLSARSGPSLTALPGSGGMGAAVTAFDEATGTSRLLTATAGSGGSWEPAVEIAASTGAVYLQPQIAAGSSGRLAVTVYRLDLRTKLMDLVLLRGEPGRPAGRSPRFLAPVRVNSAPFDPLKAVGTGNSRWLGNYQGLAVGADHRIHPAWTDTRRGTAQIFTAAPRELN